MRIRERFRTAHRESRNRLLHRASARLDVDCRRRRSGEEGLIDGEKLAFRQRVLACAGLFKLLAQRPNRCSARTRFRIQPSTNTHAHLQQCVAAFDLWRPSGSWEEESTSSGANVHKSKAQENQKRASNMMQSDSAVNLLTFMLSADVN